MIRYYVELCACSYVSALVCVWRLAMGGLAEGAGVLKLGSLMHGL